MEVGVACAGVEVIERGCDQPLDIDLRNGSVACGCTGAGGRNLSFHERNHLRNRPVVGSPDHRLNPSVSDRPQHGCGLRDGEREVEPCHRPTPGPGVLLGHDERDGLAFRARRQRGIESRDSGLNALRRVFVGGERPAQWCVGDRVVSHAHEELELSFRDAVADNQFALAE